MYARWDMWDNVISGSPMYPNAIKRLHVGQGVSVCRNCLRQLTCVSVSDAHPTQRNTLRIVT
jgi:hypothetical protein